MTQSQAIKALKELVSLRGAPYVASKLFYKDTRAVTNWIKNKKIPPARLAAVEQLIKGER